MSKTATAPATIGELKTQARQRWNAWAVALAHNGTMPPPRELLDAGVILGIASPADQLERDAAIVSAARGRQAEIAAAQARSAAWEAETGGHETIARLVAKLQQELDAAEAMRSGNQMNVHARSVAERELSVLRRKYPELLADIR